MEVNRQEISLYVPGEMFSSVEKYFIIMVNQDKWAAKCSQSSRMNWPAEWGF